MLNDEASTPLPPLFTDRLDPRHCPHRKYVIWNTFCFLWVFFAFVSFIGAIAVPAGSSPDTMFYSFTKIACASVFAILAGPLAGIFGFSAVLMDSGVIAFFAFFAVFAGTPYTWHRTHQEGLAFLQDIDAGSVPSKRWRVWSWIYFSIYVIYSIGVIGWTVYMVYFILSI